MFRANLKTAKWAFTTRRVVQHQIRKFSVNFASAQPGDLVLARVEKIGSHKRLQLASGRPSELYPGDYIVVSCGARYATDQYEGVATLDTGGVALLAGGGVIGSLQCANQRMSGPTRVIPVSLLCHENGSTANLRDYALPSRLFAKELAVLAVVGTSMNAGKTTTGASLVHGLVRAGYRVAAIKATGTGAFGDYNANIDAGAHFVSDFVDTGMASTYREPASRIIRSLNTLLAHASAQRCDVAVVELADGVLQTETQQLLNSSEFRSSVDAYLFAAACSVSALGGCTVLRSLGIEPELISGMISRSPLAMRETVCAAGVPVFTREELRDPAAAGALLASLGAGATLSSSKHVVPVLGQAM